MIIIDSNCVPLENYLKNFFADKDSRKTGAAMNFADFDSTIIEFKFESEEEFIITLKWDCIKSFMDNGSKEVIADVYKDFTVDTQDKEVTIHVPIAKIPAAEAEQAALAKSLSSVKIHVFSGPLLQIIKGTRKEPLQIELKYQEYMWIIPTPTGGFACGFSHRCSDKSDLPIARVIYHEFNDARRDQALNASPAAISSAERPEDLKGMSFDTTGIDGYFIFTVTPKHYKTPQLQEKLLGQLLVFRPYLDYHFKCTKAYTHYRMRYCHDNLVQVANRAKGEVKIGRGTKTISGRTMKQLN